MPAPGQRRRLSTLRNTSLADLKKSGPRTPAPPPAPPKANCCESPQIEDDGEGHKVCRNCFTQIGEANIVSDVTFSEDARGAATVQGGFIGENARHASTLGSAVTRATGAGTRNAQQEIERNARKALDKFCPTLGIPDSTRNQAINIFSLASRSNFSAGRRTDEVAAASLYAACRRQRDNQVMLMDISELVQMNVFRLGEVYKAMCKDIHLQENGGVGTQYLVEVESLIMKYCRKLEFGEATRQVAEDAVKIVRRMKRDWMVTGRHPAGLCGACIILAAKMNNFRRSVREVVYIAKVADITIMKRVNEFRRTKAATLTVEQFREYAVRLKHQHDPPVIYESELRKMKFAEIKRKRQESAALRDSAAAEENDPARLSTDPSAPVIAEDDNEGAARKRQRTNTGEPATPPETQQTPRRDADGFVIPALPTPQTAVNQPDGTEKKKRGRPRKTPPEPVIITEEELAEEEQLEHDINDNLNDDEVLDSRNEIEKAKAEERSRKLADQQMQVAAEERKARRLAEGITWVGNSEHVLVEEITPEALEAEFADDPEVQNCLLSDTEQRVKEQIWVVHNEDWLRQQQEKRLIEAVAKATGRDAQGRKKGAKTIKRKRKSKMGDGTTLAEATTPIETPADASRAMMEARGPKFSKYLDWKLLDSLFDKPSSSTSTSARGSATPNDSASKATTPAPEAEKGPQPSATPNASPSVRRAVQQPISPPETQARPGATRPESPEATARTPTPAPATPSQTQAAGEEAAEDYDDPNDYVSEHDDLDYGSDEDYWGQKGDDREDIGEDDYSNAIGGTGRVALGGDYVDEEDEGGYD